MRHVSMLASLGIVTALVVGALVVALALSFGKDQSAAQAQATAQLALDADPTNGTRPCDPIDAEATVPLGQTHDVAICVVNPRALDPTRGVDSFEVEVSYNPSLGSGPNPATASPALGDNPDANDCESSSGPDSQCIGYGWSCTPFGAAPQMGPPAHILCDGIVTVQGTHTLTAEPGLLATIHFDAAGSAGTDALSFTGTTNVVGENCSPAGPLTCVGATLHRGGAPTGPPTPPPPPGPAPGPAPVGAAGAPVAYQQECSAVQPGKVEVVFLWGPSGVGLQWVDLSLFSNGFAPGTFLGVGPLPPQRWGFVWDGLLSGRTHYARVNTLTPSGWAPSQTLAFTTSVCGGPALLGDVTQTCGGQAGTVDGTFRWTPAVPAGSVQWLDLSLYNNNFAPGTFLNGGPLDPAAASFTWTGLRSGLVHYWRLNTLTPDGWRPSSTGVFVTGSCR